MKKTVFLLLLFFTAGCATLDQSAQRAPGHSVEIPQKAAVHHHQDTKPGQISEEAGPKSKSEAEVLNERLRKIVSESKLNTSHDIYSPNLEENIDTQDVSFSFHDADLKEVIKVFMMLLEEDYMIHPDVSGRVSLFVNDLFNAEQLLDLLSGVLRVNNVAMIRSNNVWEFLPQSRASRHISRDQIISPDTDELPRRGQIIKGFRLDFITASEMVNIIRPYLSQKARVYGNESRGVLLVSDYPHALERAAELISLFDESVFADVKAKVFPLRHIGAEEASEKLENIALRFGLEHEEAGRRSRISFLPLERMNMVLAVTRNKQALDFVEAWIDGLDREIPEHIIGPEREGIYVYYVQYGDAEEIVESLRGVFDHGSNRNSDRPGREPVDRETTGDFASVSGELAGEVRFTVDRATNSIITRCRANDYASILAVIEKLDLYPKQVLIEVIIAEVRLSDATRMGVDWQYILSLGGGLDAELRVVPDVLPATGGILTLESSRRLKAALHAAVDDSQLQILSTPTLLASDNRPATINIGDQVPFPTSVRRRMEQIEQDIIDTTIQYRDTGIILKVTPKINKHGMVRMEIVQEVSSLTDRTVEGIAAPVINTRHAETSLAVDDQETIVIAGLMEQERSRSFSGVPGFSRIPGVRHLFGTSRYSYQNTELLVFITPHVISSRDDSSFLTRNFLTRLDELKQKMNY